MTTLEKSWHNLAIALAGTLQAIKLVEQLAKTGYLQTELFETAIRSLLEQNPSSTESVFGSTKNLRDGLELLEQLLRNHRDPRNADVLRYLLGIIHLQKKLSRRKDLLYVIGNRMEKAQAQVEHFGYTHDNVIANIADVYTDTISKFQFRIQVVGEYHYLQQQRVANQVRALLLCSIRAATLWRQVGGSRWQLLFYRSKLLTITGDLLRQG